MENSLQKFEQKTKSLFDQKGGNLGMIVIAIGVVALIVFIQPILAIIQAALTNILGIIALVLVISGILYVAFDKKARQIIGTLYMMGIQKLMGMVVKMNPIVIMEDGIKKLWKRIEFIEQKMGLLNSVRLDIKDKIKMKKKDLQNELDRREIARKQGKSEAFNVADRQVVRLTALTQEYIDFDASCENWYKTLSRLAELAKYTAEDATNEVEVQKERYKMVKTSHSAFKSVMSIISGNPDDRALFNQAFGFVNQDIMEKIGEMDRVINTTGGLLDKMSIDNEILSVKGEDISKKYKELGIDALFTKLEVLPSQQMNNMLQVENMSRPQPVTERTKAKYFN
jgi:uncharacterized protein YjeT (DUF2065 family)